jgi:hypothetical protein
MTTSSPAACETLAKRAGDFRSTERGNRREAIFFADGDEQIYCSANLGRSPSV